MSFMDSLASNPSSSIANQPGPQQDPLGIVNQLKDREMRDFQTKANFMSELSLKQDRLKQLFDPNNPMQDVLGTRNITPEAQGTPPVRQSSGLTPGMSQRDPNAMTAHETADIGLKQQGLGLEKQKMEQAGKLGEEALGVRTAQEKLNAKKEQDIHDQKEREANDRLSVAQQKLEAQGHTIENLAEYRKAMEARHGVEMDKKDAQHEADKKRLQANFDRTHDQMQETIDNLKQSRKDAGNKKVTTEVNPEGTKRTTSTTTGAAANTIRVTGPKTKSNPNGTYEIPADKADHWNSLYPQQQPDQQEPEQ